MSEGDLSLTQKDVSISSKQHHPAHTAYLFALGFNILVVVFAYISIFVPWAVKDLAVGSRAYAFPFKTCIEDTFSPINLETCMDNDWIVGPKGVPLTGGNASCKAYILTVIAFVVLSLLPAAVLLLLLGYILYKLWSSPIAVAKVADVVLIFTSISCFLAWILFIVYMETECAPGSIFPVSPGYSYGFILYLFNSIWSILAAVFGIKGTRLLIANQHHKLLDESIEEEHSVVEIPAYPVATPEVLYGGDHSPAPTPVQSQPNAGQYQYPLYHA